MNSCHTESVKQMDFITRYVRLYIISELQTFEWDETEGTNRRN